MTSNKTVTATFDVIRPLTGVSFTYMPSSPKEYYAVTFTRVVTPANATLPMTYTWNFGDDSAPVSTRSSSVCATATRPALRETPAASQRASSSASAK